MPFARNTSELVLTDPASTIRARQSLVDLFHEFAELPSEYLRYDNGYRSWKYTYAQLGTAARNFTARLRAQGIGKNDKVIFWSENRPEWIAAFWGCVLDGVIVVPIDYRTSFSFLRRVQEIVNARLILTGEEVRLPSWERRPAVWRLAELEWSGTCGEAPAVQIEKDDIAEIVFTSGATGEPKGVLITHGNILANIISPQQIVSKYRKWFRPLFPLRFLSLIPLSHMFGQVLTMFILPLIPGAAVFMRGYSPHEIMRQIRARHISVVVVVPKLLEVLSQHVLHQFPGAADRPAATSHWILRWWRYRRIHAFFGWKFWAFVIGAAPLPKDLEEFWSRLGFAVIQGYGLTETAPVVAFNNPFDITMGTVGKPVAGIEVKIAPDGEILVRGESVTPGYYQAGPETAAAFAEGWFHTGDIGDVDEAGNLTIRGRKKEMIVTPEGLNVFPEDVEHVLDALPGVRESAVVGRERVYAVLVLEDSGDPDEIVRQANVQLENHQKIRSVSVWPGNRLPRTEGTQKIKHAEIQKWVESGGPAPAVSSGGSLIDIVRKYAPHRTITQETTLDELGLTSLDRVQLMMDLEQHFDTGIEESMLTSARTVADLTAVGEPPPSPDFPSWNRSWLAQVIRRAALSLLWLPLTRMFARARITGREHLLSLSGPVIFASNHQSHLDTPCILAALPARYRYRAAAAMWKEYFDAHFHPERHTWSEWLVESVAYWLVALFFNAFPLPQTEAGAGQSLRYIGELVSDGWSILFFPEGERTETGEMHPFQPGIGLLAARLDIAVVPIHLRGLDKVLHRGEWLPQPGRVELAFGPPLRLKGEDYAALAKRVEEAVASL
jgi:long-chain acyl-CoA synthetase